MFLHTILTEEDTVIYADNAATTKLSEKALEAMLPFLRDEFGNASSAYSFGVKAMRAVVVARSSIAAVLNAESDEIYFTSGGSESNSWALSSISSGHVITSAIEHHSILNACHALERKGVRVTYLPVNASGQISVFDVEEAICEDTKLVSIMFANNELGTIQPIAAIGRLLKAKNILFHADAVQAVGHIPVDVRALGVDFLSASAHKFNGPKGAGILYIRNSIELSSLIHGGKQERGVRGGTENIAGIAGAATALLESASDMQRNADRLRLLASKTINRIQHSIADVATNGDGLACLPGIVNIRFPGVSGEAMMNILDLKNICVSTGSACTEGQNVTSHVLKAIGLTDEQAASCVRISYGRYNTIEEAVALSDAVIGAYHKIVETKNPSECE